MITNIVIKNMTVVVVDCWRLVVFFHSGFGSVDSLEMRPPPAGDSKDRIMRRLTADSDYGTFLFENQTFPFPLGRGKCSELIEFLERGGG